MALVARGDVDGLRLVASALERADEDSANWLVDAVICPESEDEWLLTSSLLDEAAEDDDADVAAGAVRLRALM